MLAEAAQRSGRSEGDYQWVCVSWMGDSWIPFGEAVFSDDFQRDTCKGVVKVEDLFVVSPLRHGQNEVIDGVLNDILKLENAFPREERAQAVPVSLGSLDIRCSKGRLGL